MATRGQRANEPGYETTRSGTLYWTLSLYIEADTVASVLNKTDGWVKPEVFRRAQRDHRPSLALRNAIDPLMNDIADRETRGEVNEFLLAATDANPAGMFEAAAEIRRHDDLIFKMPKSVSWTTEGVKFHAHPPGMDDDRVVRLRRFWLSHNNGAITYHLAFSHFYGSYVDDQARARSGYDPSTYYFLSLLQKLAAPKEYTLDPELLQSTNETPDPRVDVFSKTVLDIDPLDNIRVQPAAGEAATFWPYVKGLFESDAVKLFRRLEAVPKAGLKLSAGFEKRLLELVPFMEVPGLAVPKSRFMFMLHDQRFFDRLMPLDPGTNKTAPRKAMVRAGCYETYQKKIRDLMRPVDGRPPVAVHMGHPEDGLGPGETEDAGYWDWTRRADYEAAAAQGILVRANPAFVESRAESAKNPRWTPIKADSDGSHAADLTAAMRSGDCFQLRGPDDQPLDPPLQHHVPAFAAGRADCLDYLFLAGFNQNIIDFMNQDTSEILDGIDPIYPDSSEQSDERFFVRYANHRAMITYVPMSRSLEIGNDYIGTCPYAFLIHALALHNEFLARGHEERTMARIDRIEALVAQLQSREPMQDDDGIHTAEMAINEAKLAEFRQYERFRYSNPFRYDTERDVFAKLEELRGISRKKEALSLAIASLEDHASDLQRSQQRATEKAQKKVDEAAARRGGLLNILLGGTGVFGAGQMLYWIGEKAESKPTILFWWWPRSHDVSNGILWVTEVVMTLAFMVFVPLFIYVVFDSIRQHFRAERAKRERAARLRQRSIQDHPRPDAVSTRSRDSV